MSAEELVESGVRVVVNVSPSVSPRYPNPGPLELVRGGVCLIDAPGAPLFEQVREGERLSVRGASLFRNGTRVAAGHELSQDELERAPRRPAGPRHRGPRIVRRQHDALPARGGQAARRGHPAPAAQDALPRPPRARRRARPGLQEGSRDRPRLHPRLQARARRGRRRRRRAARGRVPSGRHRRGHGLGLGRRAADRRRARRARLRRRRGARAATASTGSACRRCSCRRRGSARTSRCCSPTRRAPT